MTESNPLKRPTPPVWDRGTAAAAMLAAVSLAGFILLAAAVLAGGGRAPPLDDLLLRLPRNPDRPGELVGPAVMLPAVRLVTNLGNGIVLAVVVLGTFGWLMLFPRRVQRPPVGRLPGTTAQLTPEACGTAALGCDSAALPARGGRAAEIAPGGGQPGRFTPEGGCATFKSRCSAGQAGPSRPLAPGDAWWVLGTGASGFLVSELLKWAINRPRPMVVPHLDAVIYQSFPSGHSMMSAVVYLTVALVLCRAMRRPSAKAVVLAVAGGLALLIGISRVVLGVHYPTDVLGGWLAGLAWAMLGWVTAQYARSRHGR